MNNIKSYSFLILALFFSATVFLFYSCSNEFDDLNIDAAEQEIGSAIRFKVPGESGGGTTYTYNTTTTTSTNVNGDVVKLVRRRYTDVKTGTKTWSLKDNYGNTHCTAETSYSVIMPYVEDTYYINDVQAFYVHYVDINSSSLSGSSGVIASFKNTSVQRVARLITGDYYVNMSDKEAYVECSITGAAIFSCSGEVHPGTIVPPANFNFY